MLQFARLVSVAILALGAVTPLSAADSSRDFSGRWDLDRNASDLRALSLETYEFLEVEQNTQIHCTAIDARGASIQWTYFLNGGESKYRSHRRRSATSAQETGRFLVRSRRTA